METVQHYGVYETVPKFKYETYIRNKFKYHTYVGHQRIIASFASEYEATQYRKEAEKKRGSRCTGAYTTIHEYEYKLNELASFMVIPVDVFPSVSVCPS